MLHFFVNASKEIVHDQMVEGQSCSYRKEVLYRLRYDGNDITPHVRTRYVVTAFSIGVDGAWIEIDSVWNRPHNKKVISSSEFTLEQKTSKGWIELPDFTITENLWIRSTTGKSDKWSTSQYSVKFRPQGIDPAPKRIIARGPGGYDNGVHNCSLFAQHAYQPHNSLFPEQTQRMHGNSEKPRIVEAFLLGQNLITLYVNERFSEPNIYPETIVDFIPQSIIVEGDAFDRRGRLRSENFPKMRIEYVGGKPTAQYSPLFMSREQRYI